MASRLQLHEELLQFVPTAYFQPPSNMTMQYPCIVYSKSGKLNMYSNDSVYLSIQEYRLTLIERNPDSSVADQIEEHFDNCSIDQYYTVDGLSHTSLTLHY